MTGAPNGWKCGGSRTRPRDPLAPRYAGGQGNKPPLACSSFHVVFRLATNPFMAAHNPRRGDSEFGGAVELAAMALGVEGLTVGRFFLRRDSGIGSLFVTVLGPARAVRSFVQALYPHRALSTKSGVRVSALVEPGNRVPRDAPARSTASSFHAAYSVARLARNERDGPAVRDRQIRVNTHRQSPELSTTQSTRFCATDRTSARFRLRTMLPWEGQRLRVRLPNCPRSAGPAESYLKPVKLERLPQHRHTPSSAEPAYCPACRPTWGERVVTKVTHPLLIALALLTACAPSRPPAPPPAALPPMAEPAPAPAPPPVVEEEHRERRVVHHGRVRHKVHRRHRVRHQVIEEERQPSSAPEPSPPMSPAPSPSAPYSR
jgi:hypothetical protein